MENPVESVKCSRFRKRMTVEEIFQLKLLDSSQETLRVMRTNFFIGPFTSGLHLGQHRFYTNLFCRAGGEEASYESYIR